MRVSVASALRVTTYGTDRRARAAVQLPATRSLRQLPYYANLATTRLSTAAYLRALARARNNAPQNAQNEAVRALRLHIASHGLVPLREAQDEQRLPLREIQRRFGHTPPVRAFVDRWVSGQAVVGVSGGLFRRTPVRLQRHNVGVSVKPSTTTTTTTSSSSSSSARNQEAAYLRELLATENAERYAPQSRGSAKRRATSVFLPHSRIAVLPQTAGSGPDAEQARLACVDSDVMTRVREEAADATVAVFGQHTSLMALRLQKTAISSPAGAATRRSGSDNMVIVFNKMTSELVTLSHRLPEPARDRFLLVRTADPHFALLHSVPDGKLHRLLVNFPPPCASAKSSFRRIVHGAFLALAHQKLAVGGDLIVTTDFAPLHRFHESELAASERTVSWARTFDVDDEDGDDGAVAVGDPSIFVLEQDAPSRARAAVALEHKPPSSSSSFHVLQCIKDAETPLHVVSSNASHTTSRRYFEAL